MLTSSRKSALSNKAIKSNKWFEVAIKWLDWIGEHISSDSNDSKIIYDEAGKGL